MKAYEDPAAFAALDALALDINKWARNKGFWEVPGVLKVLMVKDPEIGKFVDDLIRVRKCALVTTETSEQVEGIRKPKEADVPGFTNDEEEVADQIIRLLDYSGEYKLRIGACLAAKMAKNEGRPYQHGKAF